jgi:ComF family protein
MRQWLFPPLCVLCGAKGHAGMDLCADCREDLPRNTRACVQCALPLTTPHSTLCGQCLQKAPPFDRAHALWRYEPPVQQWVARLKFRQELVYAQLMGQLLASHLTQLYDLQDKKPDLILPVPLHAGRLRERGFNQAVEIARPVGCRLGIPLGFTQCQRIKSTHPQTELPAKERRRNVRGAFHVNQNLDAGYVALVDDVMTTGQTVHELARTLRRAGVARIDVWVCARAVR